MKPAAPERILKNQVKFHGNSYFLILLMIFSLFLKILENMAFAIYIWYSGNPDHDIYRRRYILYTMGRTKFWGVQFSSVSVLVFYLVEVEEKRSRVTLIRIM
jgi:hypothetical protein